MQDEIADAAVESKVHIVSSVPLGVKPDGGVFPVSISETVTIEAQSALPVKLDGTPVHVQKASLNFKVFTQSGASITFVTDMNTTLRLMPGDKGYVHSSKSDFRAFRVEGAFPLPGRIWLGVTVTAEVTASVTFPDKLLAAESARY